MIGYIFIAAVMETQIKAEEHYIGKNEAAAAELSIIVICPTPALHSISAA